jgi:hypothetical protein
MRRHVLFASVLVLGACCVLIADIASHKVARVVLEATALPQEVQHLTLFAILSDAIRRPNMYLLLGPPLRSLASVLFHENNCVDRQSDDFVWVPWLLYGRTTSTGCGDRVRHKLSSREIAIA